MAERVIQATILVPAGVSMAGAETFALPFDGWDIEAIDLEVPPGAGYALGFALANNGHPFIPRSAGEWLVWDDKIQRFPATDYPSAGGWEIMAYNTGQYAHNVVTRFHVNALSGPAGGDTLPYLTFVERDVAGREVVVL